MYSVPDLLDRAKSGAGVDSDYGLSKALGVGRANVSAWRVGKVAPDDSSIIALCRLSGDDAGEVAIMIHASRAANDETAAMWRSVAARLQGGYVEFGLLGVLVALCTLYEVGFFESAASALPVAVSGFVYYVKSISIVRMVWIAGCAVYRYKSQLVTAELPIEHPPIQGELK